MKYYNNIFEIFWNRWYDINLFILFKTFQNLHLNDWILKFDNFKFWVFNYVKWYEININNLIILKRLLMMKDI